MEIKKYFMLGAVDPNTYPMVKMKRNVASRLLSLSDMIGNYDDFEFPKYCSIKSKMGDYHYHGDLLFPERMAEI